MKRKPRKLPPKKFVQGVLLAVCANTPSFRQLASAFGLSDDNTIAKQSVWERIDKSAVDFFAAILRELLHEKAAKPSPNIRLKGIFRVLIQDSTFLKLHSKHASTFQAGRNSRNLPSAGLRLQTVLDLLSGEVVSLTYTGYREKNDAQASPDILNHIRPGDVVVRDLGYLVGNVMKKIDEQKAFWVSRHFNKRVVYLVEDDTKTKIDLAKHLSKSATNTGDTVEMNVVVGSGQKGSAPIVCRLIAQRLPEETVARRIREAKKHQKDRKKTYTKRHMQLLKWHIILTNLSEEAANASAVIEIYAMRWRIENVFKAIKSETPVVDLSRRQTNKSHVQVLILASVCLVVTASKTGYFGIMTEGESGDLKRKKSAISLMKVAPQLFRMIELEILFSLAPNPQILQERLRTQIEYHDRYDKRKDRSNLAEKMIQNLSLS